MAYSGDTFSNLSLNVVLIPDKNISEAKRGESWENTIVNEFNKEAICPNRIRHLYTRNINNTDYLERIRDTSVKVSNNIESVEIIHKSSYIGLPYYLLIKYNGQNGSFYIKYDGFLLFFTQDTQNRITSIEELLKLTSTRFDFRNECLKIAQEMGLETKVLYHPFWDCLCPDIQKIGFTIEADNPVLRLLCYDDNFFTLTNLGDKQVGRQGENYYVYIGEDKKYIRDRLCIDYSISRDFDILLTTLDAYISEIISLNESFIKSIENMPGSLFRFFRTLRNWKKK